MAVPVLWVWAPLVALAGVAMGFTISRMLWLVSGALTGGIALRIQ